MTAAPNRLLVLHAGTHKTATSYIQSRLLANQSLLQESGVALIYPQRVCKHKPLARALARGQWDLWQKFLDRLSEGPEQAIVSAEQFTQPLAKPRRHRQLLELLSERGYALRVVVFLRDQPDYINARYVHSIRRLYHHQDFDTYVAEQLERRSHIFDYDRLFSSLIGQQNIDCRFLPYASGLGDPFERLMAEQGWRASRSWLPAAPDKHNVQPGCQGVWLAQAIGEQLEQLGVRGRSLVNSGSVVRQIAAREGWQLDRYFGFEAPEMVRVADHYRAGNDRLAQRVWGCRWGDRFPAATVPERRVFTPPPAGTPERQHLEKLVEEALSMLGRGNRRLRKRLSMPGLAQR
ncbi:MAG: hypothetical protein VKI63_04040 [Cyanobium sp.]|nr:hypothetical protein [Cyanobium sp.]